MLVACRDLLGLIIPCSSRSLIVFLAISLCFRDSGRGLLYKKPVPGFSDSSALKYLQQPISVSTADLFILFGFS